MINLIRIFIHDLFTKEDTPDIEEAAPSTQNGCLFFACISLILTLLNIYKNYYFMAGTTAVLIIGFLTAWFLALKEKLTAARVILALLCGFLFSVYAITGENEGFAILWILLIPIISMFVIGLKIGFLLSLYFQLFLIVLFYTPLSHLVSEHYTPTFVMRFPVLYFASFGAITFLMYQRRNLFEKVHQQAYHDGLTGLYNRLYYNEIGEKADREAAYRGMSIVSFDLNRLKFTNDTMGHEAGDEIICGTAQLLRDAFPGELCFRTGGDEFAVISTGSTQKEIEDFRRRMKEWKGQLVPELNVSLGEASRVDHPELSFEELSRIADQKMYAEKAAFYKQYGYDRRR